MVVIAILCGLMTMVAGVQRYASTKSRRNRAEVQIAAYVAAAEAYKSDNATYPRSAETDAMVSVGAGGGDTSSSSATNANQKFYKMISGDWNLDGAPDIASSETAAKDVHPVYMTIPASQLQISNGEVKFLQDPWGTPIGYSTKRASAIEAGADDAGAGHNPTFDIWSTAGSVSNEKAWIGNW